MSPKIGFSHGSQSVPEHTNYTGALLNGMIGAGQSASLHRELLLREVRSSGATRINNALPRLAGGALSALSFGFDMKRALEVDMQSGEDRYIESKRQFLRSSASIATGLGVGSLAGAGASVLVAMGAPVWAGAALGVGGAVGAIAASMWAYQKASDFAESYF